MAFLRNAITGEGVLELRRRDVAKNGAQCPRRRCGADPPAAGKGNALFITLEDETGILNVLLWASRFERNRRAVMGARLMESHGRDPAQQGRRGPPDRDPRARPHRIA